MHQANSGPSSEHRRVGNGTLLSSKNHHFATVKDKRSEYICKLENPSIDYDQQSNDDEITKV